MSHVTWCPWEMSPCQMNEPCHIWMSHVTYEGVMSHMNESCHIWMSHVPYKGVMSHINESCQIYKGVMSHTNKSRHLVPIRNEPMSHKWALSHMNESHHIYTNPLKPEWVMSHITEPCHIRISHVTCCPWEMSPYLKRNSTTTKSRRQRFCWHSPAILAPDPRHVEVTRQDQNS